MTPANDDRPWALSSRAWPARRRALEELAIRLAGAALIGGLSWAVIAAIAARISG